MDVRQVPPVNQNTPRDYYNTNPLGSDFAAAYGLTTTWGLNAELDPRIIQVIPDEFGAFKWYAKSPKRQVSGKEFNWLMAQYPNMPVIVKTTTAAVAANPGNTVTQANVPVEDVCIPALATGVKIHYADGTQGVITAINRTPGAATISITSMFNLGLSAATQGDVMPMHGSIAADGTYGYDNSFTSDQQRYSNVLEMYYDMTRFDRAELQQLLNQQQTDFVGQRKRELMHRVGAANEARLWLGNYGFGTIPGNAFFNNGTPYRATFTRGILQHMAADGVTTQTTTTATCMDDVKQLINDNKLLANTNNWLIFGTSDRLGDVGIAERSDRVRWSPDQTIVNNEVTGYRYFDNVVVTPIAVDAWKDVSYYGNIMRDELIVMPANGPDVGVSLCYQKGISMMETKDFNNINDGQAQFSQFVIRGQWGVQVKKAFTFGRFHFIG